MDLQERIEVARAGKDKSNCFGTAFFLVGELKVDRFYDSWRGIDRRLKSMEQVDEAELYSLVVFSFVGPLHMGVIDSLTPLTMMDRYGEKGPFRENVPFELVSSEYGDPIFDKKPKFYRPRNLILP